MWFCAELFAMLQDPAILLLLFFSQIFYFHFIFSPLSQTGRNVLKYENP